MDWFELNSHLRLLRSATAHAPGPGSLIPQRRRTSLFVPGAGTVAGSNASQAVTSGQRLETLKSLRKLLRRFQQQLNPSGTLSIFAVLKAILAELAAGHFGVLPATTAGASKPPGLVRSSSMVSIPAGPSKATSSELKRALSTENVFVAAVHRNEILECIQIIIDVVSANVAGQRSEAAGQRQQPSAQETRRVDQEDLIGRLFLPDVIALLGHESSEVHRAAIRFLQLYISQTHNLQRAMATYIEHGLRSGLPAVQQGALAALPHLFVRRELRAENLGPVVCCLGDMLLQQQQQQRQPGSLFHAVHAALERINQLIGSRRFHQYLLNSGQQAVALYESAVERREPSAAGTQAGAEQEAAATAADHQPGQGLHQSSAPAAAAAVGGSQQHPGARKRQFSGITEEASGGDSTTQERFGAESAGSGAWSGDEPAADTAAAGSSPETGHDYPLQDQAVMGQDGEESIEGGQPDRAGPATGHSAAVAEQQHSPVENTKLDHYWQQPLPGKPPTQHLPPQQQAAKQQRASSSSEAADMTRHTGSDQPANRIKPSQQHSGHSPTTPADHSGLQVRHRARASPGRQVTFANGKSSSLKPPPAATFESLDSGDETEPRQPSTEDEMSNGGASRLAPPLANLAQLDADTLANLDYIPTMKDYYHLPAAAAAYYPAAYYGGNAHLLRYGILPRVLVYQALSAIGEEQLVAVQAIVRLVRDAPHEQLLLLLPFIDEFLSTFVAPLLLNGSSNFKVILWSLDIVELLTERLRQRLQPQLPQLVGLLAQRLGDNRIVIRDSVIKMFHQMMSHYQPQEMLDLLFERPPPPPLAFTSASKLREEMANRVTASVSTFPRGQLHLAKLCRDVAPFLVDRRSLVRLAALECVATLAQALGPHKLGSLMSAVHSLEPVLSSIDFDRLMAAIQARLARRSLPRVGPDGTVQYVLRVPTSSESWYYRRIYDADLEWIALGPTVQPPPPAAMTGGSAIYPPAPPPLTGRDSSAENSSADGRPLDTSQEERLAARQLNSADSEDIPPPVSSKVVVSRAATSPTPDNTRRRRSRSRSRSRTIDPDSMAQDTPNPLRNFSDRQQQRELERRYRSLEPSLSRSKTSQEYRPYGMSRRDLFLDRLVRGESVDDSDLADAQWFRRSSTESLEAWRQYFGRFKKQLADMSMRPYLVGGSRPGSSAYYYSGLPPPPVGSVLPPPPFPGSLISPAYYYYYYMTNGLSNSYHDLSQLQQKNMMSIMRRSGFLPDSDNAGESVEPEQPASPPPPQPPATAETKQSIPQQRRLLKQQSELDRIERDATKEAITTTSTAADQLEPESMPLERSFSMPSIRTDSSTDTDMHRHNQNAAGEISDELIQEMGMWEQAIQEEKNNPESSKPEPVDSLKPNPVLPTVSIQPSTPGDAKQQESAAEPAAETAERAPPPSPPAPPLAPKPRRESVSKPAAAVSKSGPAGPPSRRLSRAPQQLYIKTTPAIPANANIQHILANVARTEGPFEQPHDATKAALVALRDHAWTTKVEGMLAVVRLATFHPQHLARHQHQIALALAAETRNLRSVVARSAIFTIGELFARLRTQIEPELDTLCQALLFKASENSVFVREDIDRALGLMIESMPQTRAALALITYGSSAQFLAHLVERMGPMKCLLGPRDIGEHLLPAAARFIQDQSGSTRYFGRRIFAVLMQHPLFDKLLRKHVSPGTYRNICGMLETIKRRGVGEPPAELHSLAVQPNNTDPRHLVVVETGPVPG